MLYNNLMPDLNAILSLLGLSGLGINLLDIIIFVVVIFYAYEGYSLGFTLAMSDLLSFVASFIAALKIYPFLAKALTVLFSLPIGLANALAFLLAAFVIEVALGLLFRRIFNLFANRRIPASITKVYKVIDHWFGFIPGVISAFIILSFLLTIIVSLPSSPLVKQLVTGSMVGEKLIANTAFFEGRLNSIFGGALTDTLNFLTVKPESTESVALHFRQAGKIDEAAEQEMFKLVNAERLRAGLPELIFDISLRDVGRVHSKDMFERGYFSHYTPEGLSPFDRMDKAGIQYSFAGENLALAPSTSLSMLGLMNSTGHRANILSPNFKKIGIGVIDGGVYGKMYSQEFTD